MVGEAGDGHIADVTEPAPLLTARRSLDVLVLDDAPAVRDRLVVLLSEIPGLERIAVSASVSEAKETLQTLRPDVALLDLRLPDGSGLDVLREIRAKAPEAVVVILTAFDAPGVGPSCLAAGADAFFSKTSGLDELPALLTSIVVGSPRT